MIVAVVNQKGGTGKTTTTINVGRVLVDSGFSVTLVDMDPQANLSYSLGLINRSSHVAHLLKSEVELDEILTDIEGMTILPSGTELAELEMELSGNLLENNLLLEKSLNHIKSHDFVLIDCPPSYSLASNNALYAADAVLIPMQMDVFSLQGLSQIIKRIEVINEFRKNPLNIIGVVPSMLDSRRNLTGEVREFLSRNFDVPVFKNGIRLNVKAAEAPSFGASVIQYAPESNSSSDFKKVTNELLEKLGFFM